MVLCGISNRFRLLSPSLSQVIHALLTRSPLRQKPKSLPPFDLHVLSTPPAFVLSQDQTLELKSWWAFLLAHLLIFSAGLPARDNFRRPCVYHYPVDRRSSQNYFFTFCSVSLYGFQGTMLSVPLFASLRQLRYYITPLPLCQHFFRSLDFLVYFPFFPLFHSLFCTFRFILQINILRFLRNIFCFFIILS